MKLFAFTEKLMDKIKNEKIEVNELSSGQYSVNKKITSMLISVLCDNSDAYIVIKGTIDLLADAANENDNSEKNVAFKNNAPFR